MTVIVSLLSNHGPVVAEFTDWCKTFLLSISVLKTKEVIVDFKKNPTAVSPVVTDDQAGEVVNQYKHLATFIDHKLTFEPQVDAACKKAHQCVYFYWRLQVLLLIIFL